MKLNLKKSLSNLGVLILLAMFVGSFVGYFMGDSAKMLWAIAQRCSTPWGISSSC